MESSSAEHAPQQTSSHRVQFFFLLNLFFWVFLWHLLAGSCSKRRSSFLVKADEDFFSNSIVSLHLLLDHHLSQSPLVQPLGTYLPAHPENTPADRFAEWLGAHRID